jgi:hypothetical protein
MMESQFDSLIVGPLQALARQGKAVGQKVVFVDGLDECEDTRAQEDIIKLIGASVRTNSTPFRWAIFSRAEPHIRSTFEDELIAPPTRIVELPIRSPDDDLEVEIYLRYIDLSKALRLEEPLHDVFNSVSHSGSGPFARLDAFYMLIMQRIPQSILPSAQLLLH